MDDHVSEAIGRPDLIDLGGGLLCLRFETMKVVSALAAVRHLIEAGTVRPGDTVLDSSSGIYAYALALACHRYGLGCHIVGSTTVDRTLRVQLEVLGASLEQMAPCRDLKLDQSRRVRRIREILRANPRYHWMRQYHDPVHYQGYRSVADLVLREAGTEDLTLVGGVGSGASTGALATFLRRSAPGTVLAGVQPFGSVTFGGDGVSDPDIIIAGIGSAIPFGNVDHALYDIVHWIGFEAALAGSVELLRRHALFAGLSSGAAYLAARWESLRAPERTVLFVAADTGHRYADSVFARHREACAVQDLKPLDVTDPAELGLPWSRMRWSGAAAPRRAVFDGTG
ncbi:cysteine synthase A [Spinactinospora alkalitolerans]|uniref:Cysteine synthase A n=1 Tax=Spinactinospora alkalitolerans TaxID=687207 RepID=A0A852TUI4_9ACTN|nr:pyridoxal-phosphate dependent enzyme [Spinactinospora alkalitolerans]NYE47095.1 cysteine synthase A [Spinactinospora alkalitolerans]